VYEVVKGKKPSYLVSLATLRHALDRISEAELNWCIYDVLLETDEPKVFVRHRDEDNCQSLNDICYSIPLVGYDAGGKDERLLLVALQGATLNPETQGLYLTEEGLKEDFYSFWSPLASLLELFARDSLDWLAGSAIADERRRGLGTADDIHFDRLVAHPPSEVSACNALCFTGRSLVALP